MAGQLMYGKTYSEARLEPQTTQNQARNTRKKTGLPSRKVDMHKERLGK